MNEFLMENLPYMAISIAVIVLIILICGSIYFFRRQRRQKNKEQCFKLIGQIERVTSKEIPPLILELKNSFSINLIESLLNDRSLQMADNANLAEICDRLGLVEKNLKILQEAKSWSSRAKAAERLGQIGHTRAVPFLIALLKDPQEECEAKKIALQALGKIKDKRAIPYLINSLELPEEMENQLMVDVLIGFGELAVDDVIKILSSSTLESQRFLGAKILGRIKNSKAIPALTTALTDHSTKVRSEAARGLGNIRAHEAVSQLCSTLLEDPDSLVRYAAAESLGVIADDRSIATLMTGLADLDIKTRRNSMEALKKMGKKATPFLYEALINGSKETEIQAALALEQIGFVETEIEKLNGPDEKRALEILKIFAKAGVFDAITRSLHHPDLKIRIALWRILGEAPHQGTLKALIDSAENDSEWAVRLEALSAIAKLSDPQSIPILVQALQKEEVMVRERLLCSLKEAPLSLLEKLYEPIALLLQDENISIRVHAAEVLSRLSMPSLISIFQDSLSDANWKVRKIAAGALGKLQGRNTVKCLIAALQDHSNEVRIAAVKSLGWIKDTHAIEPLAKSFEWADERARNEIAIALIAMSVNPIDLTDLLMGLAHPEARAGVVWTLGLMKNEKNIPLLAKFLNDPDPTVRAVTAAALGRLGSFSSIIRFSLMEGLADPNEWVRASVVSVLGQHGDPSLVKNLISMLDKESDANTCQNLVLAIGCLADVIKHPYALPSIKKWLDKSPDDKSQAAGLIALALLKDEASFQKIFSAIQKPSLHLPIERFLKEISKGMQDRFFSFLSLDPQFFWPNQEEKSWEHYKDILRSNHEAEQRIHAIQALALLKAKPALPLIELAFAKDPNPQVRETALKALATLLESREMINKIGEAILDPSFEVRSSILTILKPLSFKGCEGSREILIPLLDSPEEEIRRPLSLFLANLYRHDWHLLADQLIGSNKKFRILGLIETLGEIGDPAASKLFLQFMKHSEPEIRNISAETALKVGALSRSDWIDYLRDPQESIRLSAIRGLGRNLDSETVEIFSSLIEDPSWKIRLEIARLLGKHKISEYERPKALLKHLAQDADANVQIATLLSLFRLGEKGMSKDIANLASNLTKNELDSFLINLQKEGVFIELISSLQYGHDVAERKEALEILAALDLSYYAQEISAALQDPSSEIRLAAINLLEQSKEPFIQQAIEALSQDPVTAVRDAVAKIKLETVNK